MNSEPHVCVRTIVTCELEVLLVSDCSLVRAAHPRGDPFAGADVLTLQEFAFIRGGYGRSMQIERHEYRDSRVDIVTNIFHVCRAVRIARKAGLANACGRVLLGRTVTRRPFSLWIFRGRLNAS